MLRSGKVVAAENGVLEVCFERPEACAHCGQCGGQKEETFVKIPGSAPVGRWIDVDMPEGQVLKASMLAYVMPLLMLLGGLALGSVLFEKEIFWALTGVVCMGISWVILRLIENLALGTAAVGYRTESMHGAGSPQAQRIMISRQGNLGHKKELAKTIAHIAE